MQVSGFGGLVWRHLSAAENHTALHATSATHPKISHRFAGSATCLSLSCFSFVLAWPLRNTGLQQGRSFRAKRGKQTVSLLQHHTLTDACDVFIFFSFSFFCFFVVCFFVFGYSSAISRSQLDAGPEVVRGLQHGERHAGFGFLVPHGLELGVLLERGRVLLVEVHPVVRKPPPVQRLGVQQAKGDEVAGRISEG